MTQISPYVEEAARRCGVVIPLRQHGAYEPEDQRDAIKAECALRIMVLRDALSGLVGGAVIDLGVSARAMQP